jgi:hypothetical protein
VLKHAVREGGGEDGGEVVVAGGEVAGEGAEEGELVFDVVADGEGVVGGGSEPAVHEAVVDLAAATGVGVVRVWVGTAYVGGELLGGVGGAGGVGVGEAGLLAVGSGEPAEDVVEAAILHHDDDDVLDLRGAGLG